MKEDAEAPQVSTTPIKDGLFLLQGRGGNVVASVGEDGILIIDDDYPEYAEAYHQALKSLGDENSLPRFVVNTHWHGDHVGGNTYWGERGAVIIAHDNVYQRMSTRQEIKAFNRIIEPSPRIALPVVTYADSTLLRFNGEQIELNHFPNGHTDGDSIAFFVNANVVHMGDHFFKDRFPFIDISSGGNARQFTANLKAALERVDDKTVIVPGHGSIADRADLQRYLNMLETTSALVIGKLEEGLSIDQVIEQGLGSEWSSWGEGFIKEDLWIQFIAQSQ